MFVCPRTEVCGLPTSIPTEARKRTWARVPKRARYDESSPSRVVGLRVSSAGISFRNNLQPLLGLTYLLRSSAFDSIRQGGPTRTSADVSVPRLAGFSLIT